MYIYIYNLKVLKSGHFQEFSVQVINAKLIYENITPNHKPNIESLYGLYNWKSVWKGAYSVFKILNEREIIYNYLHEILSTKKIFRDIHRIVDSTCECCTQEESNVHYIHMN